MIPHDMSEVLLYLKASKDVLDILRTLGGLLPKGHDHDAMQRRLEEAEKALRASEVQLAKALGYNLCQCTFPPQIMLSKGHHPRYYQKEIFVCATCNKQEPPQAYFDAQEANRRRNENLPTNQYF